jgi:hypothetical protein
MAAHLFDRGAGRVELDLPATSAARATGGVDLLRVWKGDEDAEAETAVVKATIALGLLALGAADTAAQADAQAAELWDGRHRPRRRDRGDGRPLGVPDSMRVA